MTKDEITAARRVFARFSEYSASMHGLKALNALEEANLEIERLSAVAKKLGAWDCEKCQRLFVESMLTISPHSAVCDSCLGESTT